MFIQKACGGGEIDITLLYTMKSPLDWSPSTYGYFLATTYACVGLTTLALLPFLIRFFHLTDLTLGAIGYVFKAASLAMIAYGQHTWLVFLSAVVGSPGVLIMTSAKSIISKLVGEDEQGKAFSLLSCGENVANLIGSMLFALVYAATVSSMPSLVFILDCSFTTALLCAHLVVTYHVTKSSSLLQAKSTATQYGSLETTTLDSAAPADDVDPPQDDLIIDDTAEQQ